MRQTENRAHRQVLLDRMRWFIRLRWVAGTTVVALALADVLWMGWYPQAAVMAAVGAAILAYNLVLRGLLDRSQHSGRGLTALAMGQIVLDLVCLTLLSLWTGGAASPIRGFYVFHMIFASLLLAPRMAYAAAILSIAMMAAALTVGGGWPQRHETWLQLAGWVMLLPLTVYLVNGIARRLRRQRHRLVIQNRRVAAMAEKLRAQQAAMIQHEKLAAMGQMAAGIAHEIANPLANLNSVLQLMRRNTQRLTPRNVEKLVRECKRIQRTIQQMREFVHPGECAWQVMRLEELPALGLQMVRFHRQCDCVRVACEQASRHQRVRVRPQAMQQVLTNLLLNAVDAVCDRPREDRDVVVCTGVAGAKAWVAVEDNGPGMEAELLERVFEPFVTTKPAGAGTGLGLAISQRLVTDMGGAISIASEPGRGTRVRVELPALQASSPLDDARAVESSVPATS